MRKSVFKCPSLITQYRLKDGTVTAGFIASSIIQKNFDRKTLKSMTVHELIGKMNELSPPKTTKHGN